MLKALSGTTPARVNLRARKRNAAAGSYGHAYLMIRPHQWARAGRRIMEQEKGRPTRVEQSDAEEPEFRGASCYSADRPLSLIL